jgi:hypothetical protein
MIFFRSERTWRFRQQHPEAAYAAERTLQPFQAAFPRTCGMETYLFGSKA